MHNVAQRYIKFIGALIIVKSRRKSRSQPKSSASAPITVFFLLGCSSETLLAKLSFYNLFCNKALFSKCLFDRRKREGQEMGENGEIEGRTRENGGEKGREKERRESEGIEGREG